MAAVIRHGARTLCSPSSSSLFSKTLLVSCSVNSRDIYLSSTHTAQRVRCFASSPHCRGAAVALRTADANAEASLSTSAQKSSSLAEPDEHRFDSLKDIISPGTLKAITVKPFKMTHMTPVQAAVLPLLPALAEPYKPQTPEQAAVAPVRDLLVRAKTGTGKTLAFLVPAIEARLKAIDAWGKKAVRDSGLNSDKQLETRERRIFARKHVGTLIISPTRELATQIANEALQLSYHHEGFEVRLFVGGMSKRVQMRDWMKGRRDIVVTTPGRMRDLLASEPEVAEGLKYTQTLILDEADTLLDMGFRDDIDAIVDYLPTAPERQTFLFSATVSRAIQQVARATLDKRHMYINTVDEDSSPVHAHVPQFHTVLPSASEQIPHILRLLAHDQLTNPGKSKTIVFLPTTKMTQLFATLLRELSRSVLPAGRATKVYEIHSKRTQEARTSTSNAFRKDTSGACILVTSDVSARGVDYPNVSRVIQVGVPGGAEHYIHRVGRTGRAGTNGRGDLVLLPWEIGFVTWQLQNVALKPLTTSELKKQVNELALKFDADPKSFFPHPTPVALDRHSRTTPPVQFKGPVLPGIEAMSEEIEKLLSSIDEEAINETFGAMLGYYSGRISDLRVQKGVVLQGCKDWTVEACGLPHPPFVSEGFLAKLGFKEGRSSRYGSPRPAPSRSHDGPSWAGRGQQRLKGRERHSGGWGARDDHEEHSYRQSNRDEESPERHGRGSFSRGSRSSGDRFGSDSYGSTWGDGDRGGARSFGRQDSRGHRDAGESGYGFRRA